MDITDTRRMLAIIATYDHRQVTDDDVSRWQRALIHHRVDDVFDSIHGHYERCNDAGTVTLEPGEILHHIGQLRRSREDAERRQREAQRNEAVFGELYDRRTPDEIARSHAAMREARAEVEAALAARRPEVAS